MCDVGCLVGGGVGVCVGVCVGVGVALEEDGGCVSVPLGHFGLVCWMVG